MAFDKNIASLCADLVKRAYDYYSGGTVDLPAGFRLIQKIDAPDTLGIPERWGFVAQDEANNTYVAIRGTQDLANWITNLKVKHEKAPWTGWGHTEGGFTEQYMKCSREVLKGVADAQAGGTLYVTGHSLGAAMATLAAADLVVAGHTPILYTLASPRTGDLEFRKKFEQEIREAWRIANSEDVVTTVPLATAAIAQGNWFERWLAHDLFAGLNSQHVGIAVALNFHLGSVVDNHNVVNYKTYINALTADSVPQGVPAP